MATLCCIFGTLHTAHGKNNITKTKSQKQIISILYSYFKNHSIDTGNISIFMNLCIFLTKQKKIIVLNRFINYEANF